MEYLRHCRPAVLSDEFFDRDARVVARELLGKVLQVFQGDYWLNARIIETEAYYLHDKASHASLGRSPSRQALFLPPGTLYMYYARGGDSLNFSCRGDGNAVLIKSAYPLAHPNLQDRDIQRMQQNNPAADGGVRPVEKLCAGQTLLCRSLGLKVPDWNGRRLNTKQFRLADDTYQPTAIIQTTRLGINPRRDAELPYRFIDRDFAPYCTKNPCRVRNWQNGREYLILTP